MRSPITIYGEPIQKDFFYHLLSEKDSKYLTDFKRYFNYLKKHHNGYKNLTVKKRISLDKPLLDYVEIINDWLELETNGKYNIYLDVNENLFFGFKIKNPINGDTVINIIRSWKKNKNVRKEYYYWINIFDDNSEGPMLFSLF